MPARKRSCHRRTLAFKFDPAQSPVDIHRFDMRPDVGILFDSIPELSHLRMLCDFVGGLGFSIEYRYRMTRQVRKQPHLSGKVFVCAAVIIQMIAGKIRKRRSRKIDTR